MDAIVQQCVNTRLDFFSKYVTVPEAVQPEVNAFVQEITALGEACADSAEFEAKFAANGLSDRFNGLVSRCTPIAQEMTAEQKAYSKQVYSEMYSKEDMLKDIAKDAADTVMVEAEEEMIARNRRARVAAGVDDEYNRVTNQIEDAKTIGGWIGGLFKKKK